MLGIYFQRLRSKIVIKLLTERRDVLQLTRDYKPKKLLIISQLNAHVQKVQAITIQTKGLKTNASPLKLTKFIGCRMSGRLKMRLNCRKHQ